MEFDLEVVQGFIEESQRAATPGEIIAAFLNTTHQFGCEHLASVALKTSLQQPVSSLSVVTYPDEWKRRYAEMNYHQHDPVFDLLRKSRTPFYWGDLEVSGWSREQLQILDEGRSFGVGTGLSVAFPIAGQETATITIVGDKLEKSAGIKHMFHLIATYYHQRLRMIHEYSSSAPTGDTGLTAREMEVLRWFAVGKTAWDIGMILGISEHTVRFHLSNVRKKYGVKSTVHATALAVAFGQIQIG